MKRLSKWPFLPADMHGTRRISPHTRETKYRKGQHAETLKANKAKCFHDGKGLVNKHHYLAANLPFSKSTQMQTGAVWPAFLYVPSHAGPHQRDISLLPTQADRFHVKWAVINCVISLHQLYPDKSPKSNTKKKGLALETSVKAILNHRSN